MLKVFGSTDKIFNSNGDAIIQPTKALIHKADNGDYYLELECGLQYADVLIQDNIIVANTPQGDQAFRIGNVEAGSRKLKSKCWHVFYDSANYLIADSYVVDKTCQDALIYLNNATDSQSPFQMASDVSGIHSYRCVRKSLLEAIQTIRERWSGHLVRDNFNISIQNTIGQDNGVTIRYKKNLKDITVSYNWSSVVTKLLPVGKDGITLDQLYIESDIHYSIPYSKTVSFSQDISEDDFKDSQGNVDVNAYQQALKDDLFAQAVEYINANNIPKVNYTVKANIEKITDVGDICEVIDERLGVSITVAVLSFVYDCTLKSFKEIQFGNAGASLSNLMSSISASVSSAISESNSEITVALQTALEVAEERIWSALGSSYCIFSGDQILILDRLPAQDAVNVIKIDEHGLSFSQDGINGDFKTAWSIDGTFNAQEADIINFTADLIKGGILNLGSNLNSFGQIKIYDSTNSQIGEINKSGLKMIGKDGSYIILNNQEGFCGYDRNNSKVFYLDGNTFHMVKSAISQEITIGNKMSFLPIEIRSGSTLVNDGIGLVSVVDSN